MQGHHPNSERGAITSASSAGESCERGEICCDFNIPCQSYSRCLQQPQHLGALVWGGDIYSLLNEVRKYGHAHFTKQRSCVLLYSLHFGIVAKVKVLFLRMSNFVSPLQQGIAGLELAKRECHAFFGALGTGTAQVRAGATSRRRRRRDSRFLAAWWAAETFPDGYLVLHGRIGLGLEFRLSLCYVACCGHQ